MAKRITDSHMPRSLIEQGIMYSSGSAYNSTIAPMPLPTSPRPSSLLFDIGSKIHRESGPAIYLDDGTGLYFWHGLHVPQHVIMNPESITLDEILSAENIEYKRILIERFGMGRFLTEMQGKVINKDKFGSLWLVKRPEFEEHFNIELQRKKNVIPTANERIQRLMADPSVTFKEMHQYNMFGVLPLRYANWEIQNHVTRLSDILFGRLQRTKFVQVQDATTTSETFFIQVPNTIKTARAAVAWSFKLKEDEYQPEKET